MEGRRNTKDPWRGMRCKTWHALPRAGCPWGAQPDVQVVYKEIHRGSIYCKSRKYKERGFSGWILVTVVSA